MSWKIYQKIIYVIMRSATTLMHFYLLQFMNLRIVWWYNVNQPGSTYTHKKMPLSVYLLIYCFHLCGFFSLKMKLLNNCIIFTHSYKLNFRNFESKIWRQNKIAHYTQKYKTIELLYLKRQKHINIFILK